MAVANVIATTVSRVKQSGLGTAGSSGSKYMRRVSLELNKQNDTYQSNEIVQHQQSTGATQGPGRIAGTLQGELSAGSYDLEFAALLRKDFATAFTAITSVALTIAGSGPTYTVTRGSGSYLTDGVKRGMVVRLTVGSLNAANINKNLLVVSVGSATVMTVVPLNGVALVAEGPISGCTISAPGKATYAPTTGHTNDYFSWEKKFTDLSRYELFTDVKPASADVSIPGTGQIEVSFGMAGLGRTISGSETLTSPSAASTANTVAAVQGKIVVNGTVTAVTNIQFTIDGATSTGDPEVGSSTLSDLQRGKISVTGSFAAKFSAVTLQTLRDDQTVFTLIAGAADSGAAAAEFIVFTFPAVKIFSDDASDGGDGQVVRTYQFTAQYNGSGGTGTDTHQTIAQIHDSLAA
ncbi:hypothetical protein [Synechococcus phage Ssp-JY42]|nr:tail tube protein [Synechococcus phage Yong-M4-211]